MLTYFFIFTCLLLLFTFTRIFNCKPDFLFIYNLLISSIAFKIYKKHHNPIATIISLEEITVKEEAAYLTGSDQSQDMQLDQTFQLDLLTEKERIVIFLMFEKSISAAAIARRWGCSRQSVNQIKLKALNKLKSQISAHSSSGGGDSK